MVLGGVEQREQELVDARAQRRAEPHSERAIYALRDALGAYAQALEAAGRPEHASAAWKEAEDCQRELGSGSTGGGEGLASMHELYELMLNRARAEEATARKLGAKEGAAHQRRAEALRSIVERDPNGLGALVLRGR